MFPKFKPLPKEEVEPAIDDPKIDGEELEPKAGVVVPPKGDEEELGPKAEPVGAPNSDGVVEEVAPKGLDVDEELNGELNSEVDEEPKPVEPKAGVLRAKGFEDVVEEKGFAAVWPNVPVAPKGLDWVGAGKLIPLAGCPEGFGPPAKFEQEKISKRRSMAWDTIN